MKAKFNHNDLIVINFGKAGIISGQIEAIKFTPDKVYYDILIFPFDGIEYPQRLMNIDGYFIEKQEDRFNGKSNVGIENSYN